MNLFGVVLLIATVSTTYGLKRPHIDASPSFPKEGDNITLICLGNFTHENVSYKWLYNGGVVGSEIKSDWYLQKASRQRSGSYSCQVTIAFNESQSEIKNITILYTLYAPGDVKVVPLNSTSLHISWSTPVSPDEHQKPINYNVYYRRKFFPFVVVKVTKEEYTISNLLPATKYQVQVSAVNINGEGENSTSIENKTTDGKSSKVRNLTAIGGLSQRIELSWQRPIPTNGDITGFRICRNQTLVDGTRSLQDTRCQTIGHVSNHSLTNLSKYSTYDIWVYAINSAGNGEASITRNVTTSEEFPTDVRNLTAIPSYYNFHVSWKTPLHMNGEVHGYNVSYVEDGGGQFIKACQNIVQLHCLISDLVPATPYIIEVTVSNTLYTTSKNITQRTLNVSVPHEYHDLLPSPMNIRSDSFTVRLITFHGPIRFYDVIVKELRTTGTLPARKPTYTNEEVKNGTDGLYVAGRIFNQTKWGHEFIVGDDLNYTHQRNISSLAIPNNKRLNENTYYGLFVRGYAWNNVYQSTLWYAPVKTKMTKDSKLGSGAIAGIVVGSILFICIVMAVLYLIMSRRRAKKESKEQDENEINKFSTPFKKTRPVLGGANDPRIPVKAEDFQERVFQLKANSNYKFSQQYSMISRELDRPYNYSRHIENNLKNRYHNVPAYDETRVVLELIDDDPQSDYINGNFINGFVDKNEYIATQGPLPETVFDFWRMAWESDVSTIVMLTKLEERGRLKCAQYWPNDHTIHIKDFVITPTETHDYPDHVTRTFHVTRTGQAVEKIVRQFHFIAWPDFGVPEDPSALLCFIRKVNNWRSSSSPCIIHCSAGVGRTGTYITIDSQLRNVKQNKEVNIYNNVQDLRAQRCLMVQTEDQFMFIHTALLDYMEAEDTEVEASELNEYINKKCQVDSPNGMSGLFEEFILLANNDKKDRFKEADKNMNQSKNRYKNILPYDSTRVVLLPHPGLEGSDYINASYIDSYLYKDHFIATQAPMESTSSDFWRMAWEQNCVIIVMLIKETDLGVGTFFSYWPHEKVSIKTGYFIIEVGAETTYGDYIHREIKVTNTEASSSRIVSHFQYTTWPEGGLPDNGLGLVELIGQVRRKLNDAIDNKTIIVHCSGGVGRTGVFIALSNLIERAKAENVVDVYQTVKKMRLQRTAMVQTKDQYEFCYRVVQEYLMSFDLYANYSSRESSE